MIKDLLVGKTAKEKANIKATEIAKLDFVGEHILGDIKIEIQNVNKIEGGIEIFARAWKGEKQLGFGEKGTTDLERFRIFNPPILVDDPNGDIIENWTDRGTKQVMQRKLKEDPVVATLESLSHTISLVGKEDTKILEGSVGNTTSTFYPDNTNTVDGVLGRYTPSTEAWASMRGGNGTYSATGAGASAPALLDGNTTNWIEIARGVYPIDTSALPDGDTISSATFSIYGAGSKGDWFSQTVRVTGSAQAANNAIANSDFQLNIGNTLYSDTAITPTDWSSSAYNDFTLNATGIAAISKTGVTHLGVALSGDQSNTEPTKATHTAFVQGLLSGTTGTANDPKLVVVHSSPVVGPANLKTYNTNALANIKTINTNPIANVKTLNTNA